MLIGHLVAEIIKGDRPHFCPLCGNWEECPIPDCLKEPQLFGDTFLLVVEAVKVLAEDVCWRGNWRVGDQLDTAMSAEHIAFAGFASTENAMLLSALAMIASTVNCPSAFAEYGLAKWADIGSEHRFATVAVPLFTSERFVNGGHSRSPAVSACPINNVVASTIGAKHLFCI